MKKLSILCSKVNLHELKKIKKYLVITTYLLMSLLVLNVILSSTFNISKNSNLNKENSILLDIVKSNNTDNLRIVSYGSSVATGFSMTEDVIPLLERNTNLNDMAKKQNINIINYSFCRPQDNNSKRMIEWLVNPITQGELAKTVELDFKEMINKDINYTISSNPNITFSDILNEKSGITIVWINTGTGSVIDKITRGNLKENLTFLFGFNREIKYLENAINNIYLKNHENTFVYVSGIPKMSHPLLYFFNPIIENWNSKIEKITKVYSNCQYIQPITVKVIRNSWICDIHPDKNEYNVLITSFISKLNETLPSKIIVGILHSKFDTLKLQRANFKTIETEVIKISNDNIFSKSDKIKGFKLFKDIFDKNYPFDFFPLERNNTLNLFNQIIQEKTP